MRPLLTIFGDLVRRLERRGGIEIALFLIVAALAFGAALAFTAAGDDLPFPARDGLLEFGCITVSPSQEFPTWRAMAYGRHEESHRASDPDEHGRDWKFLVGTHTVKHADKVADRIKARKECERDCDRWLDAMALALDAAKKEKR